MKKTALLLLILVAWQVISIPAQDRGILMAGAAISNITPRIGTSANGSFQNNIITDIHDETHARAIVLDDGNTQLAMVVSDLCLLTRETATAAKQRASEITGIPTENMLLSATHTHSAGTACAIFQSDPDAKYLTFIEERIADAMIRAYNNLSPARIGWGFGQDQTQVFNRRWKMKEGTKLINPLGTEDKVKMNPGVNKAATPAAGVHAARGPAAVGGFDAPRASRAARANTSPLSAAPTHTVRRSPSSGISQKAAHTVPAMAPAVFTA